MKRLKTLRLFLAGLFFAGMCLLFMDENSILSQHLSFLAKMQLLPALIAGSVAVMVILFVITLLFGRVYCSVVCPLGVFQDVFGVLGRKNRFRYRSGKMWLRAACLVVFVAAFFAGIPILFGAVEPYSAFGRIASGLFSPVWELANNGLAQVSEQMENTWFTASPIFIKGWYAFGFALFTFLVVGILARKSGRTWCNTVCPVGTVLGVVSRFSLFHPIINPKKCTHCGLCEKSCKASCIDSKRGTIDKTRCVACFNCLASCRNGSISYASTPPVENHTGTIPDFSRRHMLISTLVFLTLPAAAQATERSGEATALTRRGRQVKSVPILPPGALGQQSFFSKCTGCQLCVSNCPNHVLVSQDKGTGALQPSLSFERGYCRPNCAACSNICPTGAIEAFTVADKSAIQIGRATINRQLCIRQSENVECTTCARNCPAGAIHIVPQSGGRSDIAVDVERCVGCGACEYFCPVRPGAAITVSGNFEHHQV